MAETKLEDAEWIERLVKSLQEFREINQNVTANQIITFLYIALREGISQKELERLTGLDNGTVSRMCAILSDRGLKGRKEVPMDVVRIRPMPGDWRSRAQVLSAEGRALFQRLRSIMKSR